MAIVHALYVRPEERRTGAARALMANVARVALERGWARAEPVVAGGPPAPRAHAATGAGGPRGRGGGGVELCVEEGRAAIRFYEAIGLRDLRHRHMRLE